MIIIVPVDSTRPALGQLQIPEWRVICFLGCEIDPVKCYRIFGYMIGSNTRLDLWPFGNKMAYGHNGKKTHLDGDHWKPSGYLSKHNLWHECLHLVWEKLINSPLIRINSSDILPNFVVVEIMTRLITQWGRDKLDAIFADVIFRRIFLK